MPAVPEVWPALAPLAGVAPPDARGPLEPLADLVGRPAPARPGKLRRLVRLLQRAAKKCLNPWLDVQTRFNRGAIDALDAHARTLRDQERFNRAAVDALAAWTHGLQTQLARLQAHVEALTSHVNDWACRLQADRDERPAQVGARILENVFVHSRLPPPPGRLLDLGCAEGTNAIAMASLGFHVVGIDRRRPPLGHPNFQMLHASLARLPFPDDSFDVAVAMSAVESDQVAVAEVARVLRPGGRFLLTVPFGHGAVPHCRLCDAEALTQMLRPFRVLERAFGVREGDAWHYTADERRAGEADSRERVGAVALVVAEKP
jgi:SAM-dependent methyltransferase